ncbi:MAG: DUF4340 domain-containing protein [Planctomycetes bacterium]|nr:DUF4340 domain-containing protein [Planctomycetota bacterium]
MNFKSTAAFFGLLLGMLFLFGLMVETKKSKVEDSLLMPTLAALPDVNIDSVIVKRGNDEYQFTQTDKDVWSLRQSGIKPSIKVETFQVRKIIDQIKSARKNDEAGQSNDPVRYELSPPKGTITLKGKSKDGKEKTWTMFLGKESADKAFVYANTSDRPDRVFAVSRSAVDSMLFANANRFRSTRVFETIESEVQEVDLREGMKEVELKRGDDTTWRFVKPPLGFADYDSIPPPAKDNILGKDKALAKPSEVSVKALLAAVLSMRVDGEEDFMPMSDINLANFGLEDGKEHLRIEVRRKKGFDAKARDAKEETVSETLLIGMRVKDKNQVFARMAGDEGVFKLNAKLLDPVEKAVADPGSLRSTDVAFFDIKKVDALILKYGKEETKIWSVGDKQKLQMQTGTEKPVKAGDKAVHSLLEALEGKHEIQKFYDDADGKKIDGELGLDAPVVEATVYVDGLDKEGKEKSDKDKEGESKKDEKKETKKDEGPIFKKDAKPVVVLSFGKTDKDLVSVKRVLADGTVSRFAVPKSLLEKVSPPEGTLAFLDPALPSYVGDDVAGLKLQRGSQTIDLTKGKGENAFRWYFKEATPNANPSQADLQKASMTVHALSMLQAKKWLRKIAAGEDLDKYGLKNPALTATLQIKKDRLQPAAAAGVSVLASGPVPWAGLLASSTVIAARALDPGDSVVLKIGKETDQEKDKPGYFAQHTGSDLLFLVGADLLKQLRDIDLRDRGGVVHGEAYLATGLIGLVAAEPQAGWLLTSPIASGQIQSFDPAKVKEAKFAVRTPQELRLFAFTRDAKEKTWQDKTGLQEFTLDGERVTSLLKELAELKTDRFVSLDGQKPEHKLGAKDFTVKIDLLFDDGRTLTVTVGAAFERLGYFANSSAWPDAVFLVPAAKVEPLRQGVGYFAKDRVAAAQ